MKFLGKTKTKEKSAENGSDKVAQIISGAAIKLQLKFSNTMNQLFNNISTKKLKRWLLIFCIITGGYSIYLIDVAITGNNISGGVNIEHIKTPEHFNNNVDEIMMPYINISEPMYNRILVFEKYMDSLKMSKSTIYDSILQARPGLMDSVQVLKEIYQSQKQK
jgi:hypothetical protein